MTLSDAIEHAEQTANMCQWGSGNIKCEQQHRQLAKWLKDYKRLISMDAISRNDTLDLFGHGRKSWTEQEIQMAIKNLPSLKVSESQ